MKKNLFFFLSIFVFQGKMAAQINNFFYCLVQANEYKMQANGLPTYRCYATNVVKKTDAFQWIDTEANNKVVGQGDIFSPTIPGKYRCIVETKCGFRGTKIVEAKMPPSATPFILAYNGLSASKTMTAKGCGVEISASDFIISTPNNASLVYGLREDTIGAIPIKDSFPISDKLFFKDSTGFKSIWLAAKNTNNKVNFIGNIIDVQEGKGCPTTTDLSCTNDKIPPMLKCGGLQFALPKATGLVTLFAKDFVRDASDNCTPKNQLKYRIQSGNAPAVLPTTDLTSVDCKCIGLYTVRIWCGDNAGNWNYVETFYDNQESSLPSLVSNCTNDKTIPVVILNDGYSLAMGGDKEVTVSGRDFIKSIKDNCSTTFDLNDVRIEVESIFSSGLGVTLPSTKTVTLKCLDGLGYYIMAIWVKDGAGNWTYSLSYIYLSDEMEFCK